MVTNASAGFRKLGRRGRRKLVLLAFLVVLLALLAYLTYYFTLNRSLPKLTDDKRTATEVIQPPTFLFAISGTGVNSIGRPIGVVIGKDDRVYVSDATRGKILVFTANGRFLSTFNAIKDGKNTKLKTPIHMAFNNDKTELYVADRGLNALYVFDTEGHYLRKYAGPTKDGKPQAWAPLAVTFAPDGKLFTSDVRDTKGHRIVVFDPAGTELLAWGKTAQVEHAAEDPGDFYFPNGIAVGSDGTIYVVDGDNRRVQLFDKDGKFQSLIDYVGIPRGIYLDEKNKHLIISDALANQVDIYSLKGEKLVSFGEGGAGPGQFKFPNDIALDASGRIYVADRENHQVQVWGWPEAAVAPSVAAVVQRWGWCLSPLLLLPLLLLRRKREIVVMPDFVDALISAEDLGTMQQPKLRWTTSHAEHEASFAGRVQDGIDLGELIEPVDYSESDARDIEQTLECAPELTPILAMAKRARRLATEDEELTHLATLLELDVFSAQEFAQRMRKTKK